MADTGIFATTAEVSRKAGDNASSTSVAEAFVNDYMTQAESLINSLTRHNWSDDYSGMNADVKSILKLAASNLAAIYVLNYKPTGEDGAMSRIEYEDRVNVLRDGFLFAVSVLRSEQVQKFITGETT